MRVGNGTSSSVISILTIPLTFFVFNSAVFIDSKLFFIIILVTIYIVTIIPALLFYRRRREFSKGRQLMDTVWNSSTVPMILVDSEGIILKINPEAIRSLYFRDGCEGESLNELLGNFTLYFSQGEAVELKELCERILLLHEGNLKEKVRLVRGESKRWFLLSVNDLPSEEGERQTFLLHFSEITQFELRHEEALRSQNYLDACLDSIPDGVIIVDRNLRFSYLNRVFLQWLKLEREDLVGKRIDRIRTPLLSEEMIEEVKSEVLAGFEGKSPILDKEFELVTADGKQLYLSYSASCIKGEDEQNQGQVIIIKDVSRLKKSEKLLQGQLELFLPPYVDEIELSLEDLFKLDDLQQLQDSYAKSCGVASIITDTRCRPITAFCNFSNGGLLEERAAFIEEVESELPVYFCRKEGIWLGGARLYVGERHIANWMIAMGEGVSEGKVLDLVNRLGGELNNREGICESPEDGAASFRHFCHTLNLMASQLSQLAFNNILQARAIAEREMVEDELQRTKRYLDNIIESMPSILISLDVDNSITHWNKAASRILQVEEEMTVGHMLDEVFTGFKKYIYTIENIKRIDRAIRFHRESFEELEGKYFDVSLYPLKTEKGVGVVIMIDDITDLERMEQQLVQAQKMETIGALAGGFAHDFNNVLMGIITTISIIKMDLQSSLDMDSLQGNIELLERAGKRAADMVKQLLSLSQKNRLRLSRVDLNESVEHVVNICRNSFDKSVHIESTLLPEKAFLNADSTQIEQVLLNLCINASHAMTIMRAEDEVKGGTLKISVERFYADALFCSSHHEAREGDYFLIKVVDVGVGIEKESLARVFEPFFTTKDKENGTGLGLSMVYNIVRQHRGFITVYSERRIGSTFVVYLPVMEEEVGKVEYEEKKSGITAGEGLILVVDDEELVRKLAVTILKRCGYSVVTASNGREGVEIFRERESEIKAVLLDMSMPEMSGKEAFMNFREINSSIPVVMASGFGQDSRVEDVINLGLKHFLQKPFNIYELANIIHTAIYGE